MNPHASARIPLPRPACPRGFSLSEMLVASAVFMFVVLAAYQVFQRSQESYKLGQNQAEMVQAARVAFDQMTNDTRLAGFEFDVDGEKEPYPNQPDEPIEFMHRHALVVRANFDFDKELKGREVGLEIEDPQNNVTSCCPVVTTANDEIVGYFLGKPSGTLPGTITFDADVTGTRATGDGVVRDAIVDADDGDIHDEETVTISNVELRNTSDAGYAPPYTLYRFTVNENTNTVSRQPLIDEVYSLDYQYFTEDGTEVIGPNVAGTQAIWGDDDGKQNGVGRAERWSVRQIKVNVVTLTPDVDLRLRARNGYTGVDNFQGKRKYTLQADILPPNLGRRGARDRDITPPEPPRNVQVCSGQCGMVHVSWEPGPPEDKVTDHIVTLCSAPCADDGSNALLSAVVIANYDAINSREYAVLTTEDSTFLHMGQEIWARVIARNVTGTESECPVSDCASCCQTTAGTTITEASRPGAFRGGVGSGYDKTSTSFPDAKANNASGMLIVTDPLSSSFPTSLGPVVTLDSPRFALNKAAGAGSAPYDWTTKDLGGGVTAPMSCYVEESTPADANADLRTPYSAYRRDTDRPNTYVFRVSGASSASANWGTGVTDPRNFVPSAANLIDFTFFNLEAGTQAYTDGSSYNFTSSANGDLYTGFAENPIDPNGLGKLPARAVNPCEVYYYRFRATTISNPPPGNSPICGWEDKSGGQTGPDGINDTNLPELIKAWDIATTSANPSAYRRLSMGITPFYPPMLNNGDTSGTRDKADQNVHDSDDYGTPSSVDTYALPAYSLPQRVVDVNGVITGWVKPARPDEFYLTRVSDSGTGFMTSAGDTGLYDARMLFNAARRTAPDTGEGDPMPAAFRTYRLYRKAASSATPAANEFDFTTASPTLVSEFDTTGPDDVRRLTMNGSAVVPGPTGTNALAELADMGSDWSGASVDSDCSQDPADVPDGTTCIPYIYWLKTAQCTRFDDGIDTAAAETSAASPGFQFPCSLQFDVESIDIDPPTANSPPATVTYTPSILDDNGNEVCDGVIASARLLAYRRTDSTTNGFHALAGDFIGASDWRNYTSDAGTCMSSTFPNPFVQASLRGFTGAVRFVVEVSSNNESSAPLTGCRVRSDYGPTQAAQSVTSIPASCTAARSCGTNSPDPDGDPATDNPTNIFGYVDDARVELADNNRRMVIHIPKEDTCGSAFSLLGLELKLTKSSSSGDNSIPTFTSARISGGVSGGSFDLPDLTRTSDADLWAVNDQDDAEDDTGERDLDGSDGSINLRWRDSFCSLTADPNDAALNKECAYPLVLGGASELTVELQFSGSLCDVVLAQVNFRVPLAVASDGTITDELICTDRPADPTDQDDAGCGDCSTCQTACNTIDRNICPAPGENPQESRPGGADPDLPAGCRLEGTGRGPVGSPELTCVACTEDCAPCQCPINDNDGDIAQDIDPSIILADDPDTGARSAVLDLEYTQMTGGTCSSSDCPFSLRDIEVRIECDYSLRDCDVNEVLGKLVSARIVHGSGSEDVLPSPTTQDEGNTAYREYAWRNLTQDIVTSETFRIRLTFDDSVANTNLTRARLTIARPMPFECQAGGSPGGSGPPVCNMPAASIPVQ